MAPDFNSKKINHNILIINYLKKAEIQSALTLRTLLESLIQQIDTNTQSADSALSEILRLLSVYDLISPPQLDLFDDL